MKYILRWMVAWADLLDGLCGVVSLGFWNTDIGLSAYGKWLDYVEVQEANKETK